MKELINTRSELLITVIGVGGCGCNTMNMLSENALANCVRLVAVNTDIAVLNHSTVETKILIGESLTNGYGAGANPAVGLQAAQESEEALKGILQGSDIVIITAGFGGGTGTGASPFIAELVKEMGINCIVVVTLPFESESQMRMNYALEGIENIKEPAQAYITLSNDLLIEGLGESVGLFSAFKHSNDVLNNLLTSLVVMMTQSGFINVDIEDFSRIISYQGESVLGVGKADSEEQVFEALEQALNNPLVDRTNIATAQGVIIHICCKSEPKISTYNSLLKEVNRRISNNQTLVIAGVTLDPDLSCELEILIVASGIDNKQAKEPQPITKEIIYTKKTVDYLDEELSFIGENEVFTDIPTIIRNMQANSGH
ncbi:cell division protein FtsZ [Thalassotalea sp. PLHSN55]|uniref:cell division protein FtsZ n=1 Tax=Thalassotalea sp. PLHSN55 TaxID=3435888 RepID=UPI003F84F56E